MPRSLSRRASSCGSSRIWPPSTTRSGRRAGEPGPGSTGSWMRSGSSAPRPLKPVVEFAVSRRDRGVVAFGIGGFEERGPAEWFGEVFREAREGGLHLVAHAGETVGPESIWAALEIGAERIGHGITPCGDRAARGTCASAAFRSRFASRATCARSGARAGGRIPCGVFTMRACRLSLTRTTRRCSRPRLNREYEIAAGYFGLPAGESWPLTVSVTLPLRRARRTSQEHPAETQHRERQAEPAPALMRALSTSGARAACSVEHQSESRPPGRRCGRNSPRRE